MNIFNHKKIVFLLIFLAVIFRIGLFLHVYYNVPEVIHQVDSKNYIDAAEKITGFLKGKAEGVYISLFRSPGYPFFLSILNGFMGLSWMSIACLQLFLGFLTAFFVYRAACLVDKRLGILSFLIVVLDPPLVIYSVMLLTESVFTLLLAMFMYSFLKYLKTNKMIHLILSAFILAAAVYIRPVAMYLGYVMTGFLAYWAFREKTLKPVFHAGLLCLIVYSCIGFWVNHNYRQYNQKEFTSIKNATILAHGLVGSYGRNVGEEYGNPVYFYIKEFLRYSAEMMTTPGNFKYFDHQPLRFLGKIYGYLFVAFWMIGLLVGAYCYRKQVETQFLVLIILYFWIGTIFAITWGAGPRFRVPIIPFIAIVSSMGWLVLTDKFLKKGIQ